MTNASLSNLLPLVKVAMPPRETLMPALEAILYSGVIAEGEQVYAFEEAFSQHFGLRKALAVSSGTAALHIAFELAGAGPGTEVITTSMTAEPTNTAILQAGAMPVFADVEPDTGNLSPVSVEECISSRTRAICVVHYAGYPADVMALRKIADRHGLFLIEDCAHALGARVAGVPVGSVGDAAIFSFQAIKHMTTVDGGMLVLQSDDYVAAARKMRWFGMAKGVPRTEMDIRRVGYKYNMTNVAATVGLQQLKQIDERLAVHVENGQYFDKHLQGLPGVVPARVLPGSNPTYWLYTLLAEDSSAVEQRLARVGVFASKLHRPNHLHTVFAGCRASTRGLDSFYSRLVHLPCGWWVSDADRHRIVDCLAAA